MSKNSAHSHAAGNSSLSERDVRALCQELNALLTKLRTRNEYWKKIQEEEAHLLENPPSLLDEMVNIHCTPWGVEPRIGTDWTDGIARAWANVGNYLRSAMGQHP